MEPIIHRAGERGGADHGWLMTRHSFSFAHWYEPTRMGFGPLRVINDDWIAPHTGFGPHPHRDMEIITIVTGGMLTHEDSMGNVGTIPAGDVQVMSAGTGVVHGERNDGDEPLTLFQIWIEPNVRGATPRYEQARMHLEKLAHGMQLLATGQAGTAGALAIHQDASLFFVRVAPGKAISYPTRPDRLIYAFVVEGELSVAGTKLGSRDAIGLADTQSVELGSPDGAACLLFDLPSS